MKRLSILFVVILLVGSATIAMAGNCGRGNGMGPGCYMGPCVAAGLNLTAEQSAKAQALRDAHLKKIIPLQNQLSTKRAELKLLWTQTNPDQAKIMAKQKEINDLWGQLREKRIQYRLEFRKLLTAEQQAKFMAFSHGRGCCSGKSGRMGCW